MKFNPGDIVDVNTSILIKWNVNNPGVVEKQNKGVFNHYSVHFDNGRYLAVLEDEMILIGQKIPPLVLEL